MCNQRIEEQICVLLPRIKQTCLEKEKMFDYIQETLRNIVSGYRFLRDFEIFSIMFTSVYLKVLIICNAHNDMKNTNRE